MRSNANISSTVFAWWQFPAEDLLLLNTMMRFEPTSSSIRPKNCIPAEMVFIVITQWILDVLSCVIEDIQMNVFPSCGLRITRLSLLSSSSEMLSSGSVRRPYMPYCSYPPPPADIPPPPAPILDCIGESMRPSVISSFLGCVSFISNVCFFSTNLKCFVVESDAKPWVGSVVFCSSSTCCALRSDIVKILIINYDWYVCMGLIHEQHIWNLFQFF